MSIHHRSQGAINARRAAIKQRIKQGVFEAWLLKERNKRRRRAGLPPIAAPAMENEDAEPVATADDLDALTVGELVALCCFGVCVFALSPVR